MSQKENLKIAHVTKHKGAPVLSFTKAAAKFIPPSILFGSTCRLIRKGVRCRDHALWNPKKHGVVPGELEYGDTVHFELASPNDFYKNLLLADRQQPGILVSMDPDLRTALENQLREPAEEEAA